MENSTQLTVFAFKSSALRSLTRDGEPWFVAKDALSILDLDRKALERLDDDEKGVVSIHTLGGPQKMGIVNESGFYSIILGSRKPEARAFKKWVTSEVLPAIRKTGRYSVQEPAPSEFDVRFRQLVNDGVLPSTAAVVALQLTRQAGRVFRSPDNQVKIEHLQDHPFVIGMLAHLAPGETRCLSTAEVIRRTKWPVSDKDAGTWMMRNRGRLLAEFGISVGNRYLKRFGKTKKRVRNFKLMPHFETGSD